MCILYPLPLNNAHYVHPCGYNLCSANIVCTPWNSGTERNDVNILGGNIIYVINIDQRQLRILPSVINGFM